MYPAPKPLSIFTTAIPGAHAFSIVKSGTSGRAVVSGRLGRTEVLRRFRAFLEEIEPRDPG